MNGNRMSALPIARFCGQAPLLSLGAGRAAAMSTAFHAICSNGVDRDAKLAQLTPKEREEMGEWHPPADAHFSADGRFFDGKAGHVGFVLKYEEARTELPVAITESFLPCAYDAPEALSAGTADMAWVTDVVTEDGEVLRVAFIGDIKKTRWTTLDGPDSLQLIGYAFAVGALEGCDAYCCGIWHATEGEWSWGKVTRFDDEDAVRLGAELLHAARNRGGDYATGPHCAGCWSRFRCPAHLIPLEEVQGSLKLLVEQEPTDAGMLQLLQLKQRAKDTLEVIGDRCEAYALAFGGIPDGNGKRWGPVHCQGRVGFDSKRLLAEHPEMASYQARGPSYDQFRWTKA